MFSLHSRQSCGIGEFYDLIPLIFWCEQLGFDLIQLLPLNDTGIETSPYCALSANALNPIHLSLGQLSGVSEHPKLMQQITNLQKLTSSQKIDYKIVLQGKELFFIDYFKAQAHTLPSSSEYQRFKDYNPWLPGYALFKTLKVRYNWHCWEEWPAPFRNLDITDIDLNTVPELHEEIERHIFLQFLCFQQMKEVKSWAASRNIFIKGDIPILINKESADVWLNRKLFLMEYTAGAPPDMYAKEGQNWGFPLYNWAALENEFYQWWIERLKSASNFYHIYRLDHIVGFFRIWGIPQGQKPKNGFFIPINISHWIPQGEAIMRMMLNNCEMLPIGEDLGVVPSEVRLSLKKLGICGTKVMRWERRWNTDKGFINPLDYDPISMTTASTHDSETLQLWWAHQRREARLYANDLGWTYQPELSQEQRMSILMASHQSSSIFHVNLLQEYLALIPEMTWPNPVDERINLPGTISNANWTYRFKPSVEDIVGSKKLTSIMSCFPS